MAKRRKKARRAKKKKRATRRRAGRRRPAKRKKRRKASRRRPARRRSSKRRKTARRKKKRSGRRRRPSAAFMKPMKPSPALAAVIGAKAMPRTQVTKKLWNYIKRNRLQDKKNRRMINADAKLKKVFGGRGKVNMFQMTKLVSRHLK